MLLAMSALSPEVLPLAVGTALALGAATFVLVPMLGEENERVPVPRKPVAADPRHGASETSAVQALREIEFDRATGKLSDTDYAQLKAQYTTAALAELRAQTAVPTAESAAAAGVSGEEVEAVIQAYRDRRRECVTCGPRSEPDAVYCSTCGRYLAGSCAACDAPVQDAGARFCANCGHRHAA